MPPLREPFGPVLLVPPPLPRRASKQAVDHGYVEPTTVTKSAFSFPRHSPYQRRVRTPRQPVVTEHMLR